MRTPGVQAVDDPIAHIEPHTGHALADRLGDEG